MMSRATLIDERQEVDETEATQELTADSVETPEPEESQDSDIPERYRGKSAKELVQMYEELERFSGKQRNEVGETRQEISELRELVDGYIQTELSNKQAPQPQQEDDNSDDVDFFVDPQAAVNRAIDNHPKIREAEAYTQQYKQQTALAQLKSSHPDMESILKDTKFAEWIKGSKVRTQLFVQADKGYDYDAANELFNLWKEKNQVVQQTAQAEKVARQSAVKSANTGNARGAAEGSRKKVYRRADIIKLMKTDPDRYNALSDEILKAYAEGRVK
tara:strand:+ start:2346 stop:3170 length:825 start_codon:yes stop_codon:yes gene_type:complete